MKEPPKSAMGEQHEDELLAIAVAITTTTMPTTRSKKSGWEEAVAQLANNTIQFQKSTTSYIHALEVQIGQRATVLAYRSQGSLSSNTENNPKEHANTITLLSGRQLKHEQPRNTDAESSEESKESNKDEQRMSEDDGSAI